MSSPHPPTTFFLSILVTLFTALVVGCTYVNIPAQEGDVAWHDANNHTVREVLNRALKSIVDDQPPPGRFAVLLPDGSSAEPYLDTYKLAQDQTVWTTKPTPEQPTAKSPDQQLPTLQIKQVRIRGSQAQVDVLRSLTPDQPGTFNQLVTADLTWSPVDGWVTERLRTWRTLSQQATSPNLGQASTASP